MTKKDLQKLYIEMFEDHYKIIKSEKVNYYLDKYLEVCKDLGREPNYSIVNYIDYLPF